MARSSILRIDSVLARSGNSRTQHFDGVRNGTYPPPISIGNGGRAKGWLEDEVDAINAARAAGYSDAELRDLVARLVGARQAKAAAIIESALTTPPRAA